ncbi:DNA polymerase III subunit delta [Aquimarina agarilytica]|uniref:DNA polymerase III subunit delta n=1 Tax=Aquimarina agarilytica TaxID=1087449 RepID=UPI00028809CE|nr:DNA polymerase III subunit delta [Aquimarina agarilytica]
MDEAKRIITDIKAGNIKPIYFLMGDEPYFIDRLTEYIQNNILAEHERDFNQTIVYGKDTTVPDIVSMAKRFPMMAERQVVIVKEAQDLSRSIDKLESYAENPLATTVLVFCYKYKKLDKRKKITKIIAKNGLVFESKKLYENQVGDWIQRVLSGKGFSIDPKAAHMLVEFLGTDLGKINNELEKLQLILPAGTTITPQAIEQNIGISKDFNVFELTKALGTKDVIKAHRICNYFTQNPKEKPLVVTVSLLFSYFSKVMQYHGLTDKSEAYAASQLKVNKFFVKDYISAARNYPMRKVSYIIEKIRAADVKSKGVGASPLAQGDILKELLVQILN